MSDRTKRKKNDTNDDMAENFSNETYALTDEQKERIYSTISRKLNIEMTDSGKSVTGVEKCSRSQIFHTVTTAASAAALIAALSINFSALHNMKKSISEISAGDDSITENVTDEQSVTEEMPIQTEQYKAIVTEPAATSEPSVKAMNFPVTESLSTTFVQTTETTVITTESEKAEETSEPETTETEAEPAEDASSEPDNAGEEETTPQTVESPEDNELQKTAEFLIAEYDNIVKIKTFNILRSGDEGKLTCIHEAYREGEEPFTMTYSPVDTELYPDMETMKNYYYTVICSSKNEDSCFGPEYKPEDYPDGLHLPADSPEYAYITYNGILYGLDLSKEIYTVRTDEPAVISNIGDYGFSAEKKYKDTRGEDKFATADFSIVKDTHTGNYVILNVNYK